MKYTTKVTLPEIEVLRLKLYSPKHLSFFDWASVKHMRTLVLHIDDLKLKGYMDCYDLKDMLCTQFKSLERCVLELKSHDLPTLQAFLSNLPIVCPLFEIHLKSMAFEAKGCLSWEKQIALFEVFAKKNGMRLVSYITKHPYYRKQAQISLLKPAGEGKRPNEIRICVERLHDERDEK
jgi:hypothetical protein